jgi:serine protease Do
MYNFEKLDSENYKDLYNQQQVELKHKKKPRFLTYISLVLVTSIVTSAVVGGFMYSSFTKQLSQQVTALKTSTTGSSNLALGSDSSITKAKLVSTATSVNDLSVADIAKKVGPSIVGIKMSVSTNSRFFGVQSSDAEGSGIIISSDGYIMTNYHVVEYADPKQNAKTTLKVYLPDKREATAKFIGGDSDNDLALIKIDLKDLPVAELGDSSQLEVGEPAVAIGNPLGMEFAGSVTFGVISALNRQVNTGDKR